MIRKMKAEGRRQKAEVRSRQRDGRRNRFLTSAFCLLPSAFVFFLTTTSALAQNADPYKPLNPLPICYWFLSLPSASMLARGTWEVNVSHCLIQSLMLGCYG